jgi:hypothetical protein
MLGGEGEAPAEPRIGVNSAQQELRPPEASPSRGFALPI